MYMKIIILSILFLVIVIYGKQESDSDKSKEKGISVTAIASNGPFSEMEFKIINSFKSVFKDMKIYNNDSSLYEILLSFKEINKLETIISVTILQPISEKVITLGKENQIFYSSINLENKKSTGKINKEIREYVSEEYMKQFRIVVDSYIYILPNSNLEKETQKIINQIMDNPFLKSAFIK